MTGCCTGDGHWAPGSVHKLFDENYVYTSLQHFLQSTALVLTYVGVCVHISMCANVCVFVCMCLSVGQSLRASVCVCV